MTEVTRNLLKNYPVALGAGGFGLVKTGNRPPFDGFAVKFMRREYCETAKKEYIINKKISMAFDIFLRCEPTSEVTVVETLDFVNNCNYLEESYGCGVIMKRLISPSSDGYAIHIAINGQLNRSNRNKIIYSNDIPRGYFYDADRILDIIKGSELTLDAITYRIGLLDGIAIFGARIAPIDAEYILVKNPNLSVAMIDYGLFIPLDVTMNNYQTIAEYISTQQDNNLYYHPHSDAIPREYQEICKIAFIRGITKAYECFRVANDMNYDLLYNKLVELYED